MTCNESLICTNAVNFHPELSKRGTEKGTESVLYLRNNANLVTNQNLKVVLHQIIKCTWVTVFAR